jgi:hypothetical protein
MLYRAVGRNSSVRIATRYGLDGQEIESRWGRDFLHLSKRTLVSNQPPIQWIPGLYRGKAAGTWRWPPTPHRAEVKERVELYLFSPLWASVPCSRLKLTISCYAIFGKNELRRCDLDSAHLVYIQSALCNAEIGRIIFCVLGLSYFHYRHFMKQCVMSYPTTNARCQRIFCKGIAFSFRFLLRRLWKSVHKALIKM